MKCETTPAGEDCTVECALKNGDEAPTSEDWENGCGLGETDPMSAEVSLEAEQDLTLHYRARLTDDETVETATQTHTTRIRFDFAIDSEDLPPQELFYANQGSFELTCTSPLSSTSEGTYGCDFSCTLDTDEDTEICADGILNLDVGDNENSSLTITACSTEFEDHCVSEIVDFTLVSPTWKAVSAGYEHTCAILEDDTLWCWGASHSGRLGLGDTTSLDTNFPNRLTGQWKEVSTGLSHTCAISLSNELHCWGQNSEGQVDPASSGTFAEPNLVGAGYAWATVTAGADHTCALSSDDELFCWGRNNQDQLGPTPAAGQLSPVVHPTGGVWAQLSAGEQHTCAIDTTGDAWCWGNSTDNRLGHNSGSDLAKIIGDFSSASISAVRIAAGRRHTCAVADNDRTYCWGDDSEGQLGHSSAITDIPQSLVDHFPIISAGGSHSCGIDENDLGHCWGANVRGQLGIGTSGASESQDAPQSIERNLRSISAGDVHTCAIETNGTLNCWGRNIDGQLAIPGSAPVETPTPITWSHDF